MGHSYLEQKILGHNYLEKKILGHIYLKPKYTWAQLFRTGTQLFRVKKLCETAILRQNILGHIYLE